MKEVHIVH